MRRITLHVSIFTILLVFAVCVVTLVSRSPAQAAIAGVNSGTPCVSSPAPAAGQWRHIIVLMLENQNYSNVIGSSSAPYLTSLSNKCGTSYSGSSGATPKNNWHDANYLVSGVYEASYSSKPSYAVITNGRPASETGINSNDYSDVTNVDNIYNVLRLAGKDAKNYYSGPASSTPCASANYSGSYHDAIRYYTNLGGQSSDPTTYCNTHNKSLSTFMTDLNNGNLPAFSMILPTNCENMHSCSSVSNVISNGDNWSRNFLDPILESDRYKSGDTAIMVIWDENTAIPNVLLAPSIVPGSRVPAPTGTAPISHYSALRTFSEMLGVSYVGYAAQAPSLLTFFSGNGVLPPPTADTTAPTVAITAPVNGSTLNTNSTTIAANASDNLGVTRVDFSVNGQVRSSDTSSPYSYNLDMTGQPSGTYTLRATAYDAAGNSSSSTVNINFVAPTTCAQVPTTLGTATMSVNIPSTGTYKIWNRIKVPNSTNNSYYLQIDSGCPVNIGDSSTIPANTWSWVNYKDGNPATLASVNLTSGTHTVTMIGKESGVLLDRLMFISDTCVPTNFGDNCTTAPDTTAPTVALTSPAPNSTVSGTVNLAANATDNTNGSGIARVDFYNNGTSLLGSDTTSPYEHSWDTSRVPDGAYAITARATDVAGNTSTSNSITVTVRNLDSVAPTTPTNFRTISNAYNLVKLGWDASTDTGGSGLAGYHIYRNGVLVHTGTSTTFDDTTVTATTQYNYTIDAYDVAGNRSSLASLSVTTPRSPDTTAPSTPTNLTAQAWSPTQVNLSWSASTDTGGSGLAGYRVLRNGVTISSLVTATSYSDMNALANTQYSYTIVAVDNSNNISAQTPPATVTTPSAQDTTAPSTPTNLTALVISSTQVNLSWNTSTDTGGSGLAGYNIYRNNTKINTTAVINASSYGDATAVAGQTYQYTVTAVDGSNNESPRSNIASVSVPPANSTVVLSDNFESSTFNWTPILGDWRIVSDGANGNVYHQDALGDAWSTFGSSTWKDYSVEANVRPVSFNPPSGQTGFASVYGRWQDDNHWYYVVLRSNGMLELKSNNANTYTVLASKSYPVTPGTWYKVRLQMIGNNLKVFVNDQEQLTATNSEIQSGKVALGSYYAKVDYDNLLVTQNNQAQTITLTSIDDAEIRKDSATSVYGSKSEMSVDDSDKKDFLLKFRVSDLNGRTVTSAKLRLYNTNSSSSGGSIFRVASNDWLESTVNWSNAPAPSTTPLFSLGAVSSGNYYTIDLSNSIRAEGIYSFRVSSTNSNGADYASRQESESNRKPTLILTVQ